MKSTMALVGLATMLAATTFALGGERLDERNHRAGCAKRFATDFDDRWIMTRKQAKHYVAYQLPGKVTSACADAGPAEPHYHVDVRLPHGQLARLNVDAHSGEFTWRVPALLPD